MVPGLINIGPQHPATHGVLRLIVILGGEIVLWIIHELGLLHRGTEKLIESIYITSIISYFDRLDYVSNISQELLFIQLVERLINCYLIDYISLWRTLFLEFYKNLNHILNITTHAIDLGLFTTMLWLFDEREKLINSISVISGTRFHVSLLILVNLRYDVTLNWIKLLFYWLISYVIKIKELNQLLTVNSLWKIRLYEIGIIKKEFCLFFGISGIISRSIGIYIDIRLLYYELFIVISLIIYISLIGDCLDRYVLRLNEIIESCRILFIVLWFIYVLCFLFYSSIYILMELLINEFLSDFILYFLWFILYIISIESSKGIYSVFILLFSLFIINITTNDFLMLNELNLFCKYYLIGDLIAVLGSIDFVLGSVDLLIS